MTYRSAALVIALAAFLAPAAVETAQKEKALAIAFTDPQLECGPLPAVHPQGM